VNQGAAQRKAIQGRWTLRLEIACMGNTVQHAVDLLKGQDPDIFLVPMAMRDGRTCYQIFFGSFGSEAAAKDAAKNLPAPFHAEGNRPKPFRAAQIADRQ
jgi:septal ring-binding cell division protein DamX